jgi:hypothetical protein
MANLVSGKLPPPAGMTYEQFSEYSLYLALREFLLVYQGPQAVASLDASYIAGSKINGEALLKHPMGKIVAAMGQAIHGGGVLPGWDNVNGTMNWAKFSSFARWFAKLNKTQQNIVLGRMRDGSETPWAAQPKPAQVSQPGSETPANPSFPGGNAGMVASIKWAPAEKDLKSQGEGLRQQSTDLATQKDNEGIGVAGWAAIIAAVVALGFLIYKVLSKPSGPAPQGAPSQ